MRRVGIVVSDFFLSSIRDFLLNTDSLDLDFWRLCLSKEALEFVLFFLRDFK